MSIRQGVNTIAGAVGKYPLNERNITNCITEIPQDIKLELNNGTLTLKAGSKVYVPNGAGVFDVITIASDLTLNGFGTGTRQMIVCYRNTQLDADPNSFSGTSTPSGSGFFYNTSTNKIDYVSSGTAWGRTYSFPLCIVTFVDSTISSIDQVFNGFGYIGSTVFALPGVKGLIPDGRNADGSLKNIETAISIPKIMTMKSYMAGRNNAPLCLISNASLGGMDINNSYYGSVEYLKDLSNVYKYYSCWYCAEDNLVHYFDGSAVESISQRAFIGSFDVDTNNKITAINPKFAFHAVDYSDTNFIANQAMPKVSRYINLLPLGVSGSPYIAPADGYIVLIKQGTTGQYITIDDGQNKAFGTYFGNGVICLQMPVSKGDSFNIWYDASGTTERFVFIYANGAQ